MIHSFKDLGTFSVRAEDAAEGKVDDIYFDDAEWTVRYLVVDVGWWSFGHEGLIARDLLGRPDTAQREFPVHLTAEEIRGAKEPIADPPVSKQEKLNRAASPKAPPLYLLGPVGMRYSPLLAERQIRELERERTAEPATALGEGGDPHLRSMSETVGRTIEAQDGPIGTVKDFLINPLDWSVRWFVIDTGDWLPGPTSVLATEWIREIAPDGGPVRVDTTRHKIETAPSVDDVASLRRSDEERLFGHYGGRAYWAA